MSIRQIERYLGDLGGPTVHNRWIHSTWPHGPATMPCGLTMRGKYKYFGQARFHATTPPYANDRVQRHASLRGITKLLCQSFEIKSFACAKQYISVATFITLHIKEKSLASCASDRRVLFQPPGASEPQNLSAVPCYRRHFGRDFRNFTPITIVNGQMSRDKRTPFAAYSQIDAFSKDAPHDIASFYPFFPTCKYYQGR